MQRLFNDLASQLPSALYRKWWIGGPIFGVTVFMEHAVLPPSGG